MITPTIGPFNRCKPITRAKWHEELARLFTENAYSRMVQVRYMGPAMGTDALTGDSVGTCFYAYQVAITTHPAPIGPEVDYAKLTTTRYYVVWINAPKGE